MLRAPPPSAYLLGSNSSSIVAVTVAEAALTVAPAAVTVAIAATVAAAAAVTVMDLRNRVYQYNLIHSITNVYAAVVLSANKVCKSSCIQRAAATAKGRP